MNSKALLPGEASAEFYAKIKKDSFLRVATIQHVDNERGLVELTFNDSTGGNVNIPITYPAFGAGFIKYVPNIGDYVICGFKRSFNNLSEAVPLQYIPASSILQRNFGRGIFRRYHDIKIYPGEIALSSEQGSLIVIDRGLRLADAQLREFGLNPETGKFFLESDGYDANLAGIRVRGGVVLRPGVQDLAAFSETTFPISESGNLIPIITKAGIPADAINLDSPQALKPAFLEYRIEVPDGSDLVRSPFEVEDSAPYLPPAIEMILGSAIGNKRGNVFYGRPYRLQIFGATNTVDPQVMEVLLTTSVENDEPSSVMPVYLVKVPYSGVTSYPTAIAIDKEGQYFAHFAASKTHPNGQGNSAEIATDGRVKLYLGNNPEGVSLHSRFKGGWKGVFGKTASEGKSIDLVTNGSVSIKTGSDAKGVGRYTEVLGDDIEIVQGKKVQDYRSSYEVKYPNKSETITGSDSKSVVGDSAATYGSNVDQNITGTKGTRIGRGRATIIALPADDGYADATTVIVGNVKEDITLGNKEIKMTAGNFTEQIIAGNRETSITAGNFAVNIIAGNIDVATIAGNVSLTSGAGTVQITGGAGVSIVGGAPSTFIAPTVGIGQAPVPLMGIVTALSHRDYITGLPLIPCFTAFAGP